MRSRRATASRHWTGWPSRYTGRDETRINQEREQERQARLAQAEEASRARREHIAKIEAAKNEFYGLFGSTLTRQLRGRRLETALNNLFAAYGVLVHDAFHIVGECGEGIVEQIDGVIELKGVLHFVEMKWYEAAVGKGEIAEHLVRLISRAEARGIFISASGYTDPAIQTSREFLQHKVIVLASLQEIVRLLEQQGDLADFFLKKVQAAQIINASTLLVVQAKLRNTGPWDHGLCVIIGSHFLGAMEDVHGSDSRDFRA